MGAYCVRTLIRRHTAQVGEIMVVLWSDYYGAAIFGDGQEIACIPHNGCWLEIVGTAETSHRKVNRLLPGQVIRSSRSFLLGDRFELPGGPRVGLGHLVGFRLLSNTRWVPFRSRKTSLSARRETWRNPSPSK
jgi:hypothetical protein